MGEIVFCMAKQLLFVKMLRRRIRLGGRIRIVYDMVVLMRAWFENADIRLVVIQVLLLLLLLYAMRCGAARLNMR